MAARCALAISHFAQKINANLSQIFENTALQMIFFMFFLLTMDFRQCDRARLKGVKTMS